MGIWAIRGATVEVADFKTLLRAWKCHRQERHLIRLYIVTDTLTKAQLRRLPLSLRAILKHGKDDSIAWLERLYLLEDPRK